MNLEEQLSQCLHSFAADGLYVIGGIPPQKLSNAIQNFPIDPRDTILALIDATVMGSCKNGMAFGMRGVYWKNDWTTQSQHSYMSWETLSRIKHLIGRKTFEVTLGPGNLCNLSGSSVKPPHVANLLHQLITVYNEFTITVQAQKLQSPPHNFDHNPKVVLEEAPILLSQSHYTAGLTKAFAVMICADGTLEDSEIELAVQFLEADDEIRDKASAIESLTTNIENLRAEYEKSKPLFKLKCSKLIAQIRDEISGSSQEHARVMIEGLFSESKDRSDPSNREIFEKLITALSN